LPVATISIEIASAVFPSCVARTDGSVTGNAWNSSISSDKPTIARIVARTIGNAIAR
jgi:hypothetical protein